ncbi:bifunctional adenosylcobinamide kinase/adenosylcobinamide-phosphate guanylyltransferase [Ornithinimicrobium sp. F0845]|uniref:bifunctional adenosylcobinamide kinase/adenosylcobinamide-phosphate guanylyltransferase n=1 Tax=Ornithinimicrobium sp. F0845 TaxID=2926412 RepID=UPI001FF2B1E4|nr:bifunctional adenosylcobinamide kinase/adenosylcobinamide-phosphate guanylyltransferase [Ornithinimicrobium sp. F0845]MCK0113981.1 bifunctional adenosylcobinamide kinase/adenosylcobinamide-phosphate guanylyltransferase [Ornithinimicrobium sp. F0845]
MATTLVLGAARNGKSDYAEALLAHHPVVTYVATGPKLHDAPDQAWADQVLELRAKRPASWETVETTALSRALLLSRRPVLIDTLSHWVWRTLDEHDQWRSATRAIETLEPILDELLVVYRSLSHDVVAISDEVGWGREPTNAREGTYREVLAHVNNRFSAVSQRVHLLVGGRVLDLSNAPSPLSASRSGEVSSQTR